jgi:hypothetical protein
MKEKPMSETAIPKRPEGLDWFLTGVTVTLLVQLLLKALQQ